jgi:N-acetylglucosaminyldiphosphoundecaprenol N-acetyl-beta-D-mannosaminyltransferase
MNQSDLSTPDGMPLVWTLRRLGYPRQERVYGPELTMRLIDRAEQENIPVGFYGSTQETLERLLDVLNQRNPELKVTYTYSPPFRELTAGEDEAIVREINASGARILFVGLGCPKQERWMAGQKGRVQAVMLGVGAAFDFLAGVKSQAPRWMQKNGLEWVYRLTHEPRRLWRRYFYHNPRYIFLVTRQLLNRGG